jgi:hypothetical protein
MRRDFIPVEKIEAMASAAARCLDPELFEKGRQHYRKGRVEYARVFGPRIYAQVSDIIDGKKYIVQLHIDSFPLSTCTCARKHLCEHIAAVLIHHCGDGLQPDTVSPGFDVPALEFASPPGINCRNKKELSRYSNSGGAGGALV